MVALMPCSSSEDETKEKAREKEREADQFDVDKLLDTMDFGRADGEAEAEERTSSEDAYGQVHVKRGQLRCRTRPTRGSDEHTS